MLKYFDTKTINIPIFPNGKFMFLGVKMFNPIAFRMAKTLWSFDCSECKRVKHIRVSRIQLKSFEFRSNVLT